MNELRTPPNAPGPEKSILSSILQDPDEYLERALEGDLQPSHFYSPANAKLYQLAKDYFNKHNSLELVSLTQHIIDLKLLDVLGGPSEITKIYTYAPNGMHFDSHLEIVKKKGLLREIINNASSAIERAYSDPEDVEGLRDDIEAKTLQMGLQGREQAITKEEVVDKYLEKLGGLARGDTTPMGIPCGFPLIDELLYGWHGGRIHIVSGKPTSGKSVLGALLCWHVADQGIPTLFFSQEMPEEEVYQRLLPPISKTHALIFKDPKKYIQMEGIEKIAKPTWIKIKEASISIKEKPFRVHDEPSIHIDRMVSLIRKDHRQYGTKLFCIDYLQLMKGNHKVSRDERMADISHRLQAVAKELKVDIILLSQENEIGNTKYSTALSDDCDSWITIMVNNDKDSDEYGQHEGLFLKKDRHNGHSGRKIPLFFRKEYLDFLKGKPIIKDNES